MVTNKLEMNHVSKSFPGVKALNNVSFQLKKGTVKALCGENGAGKSTLMKILDGMYQPDEGNITIDGIEQHIRTPMEAKKLGIAMIFQELTYVPEMTIAENLFLGNWPCKYPGKINWQKIKNNTKDLLRKEDLNYSYDTKMRSLSVSDIQLIEIVKAVTINADVIIMDEPTSSLTESEIERLFKKIETLKANGVSIIYISHKMEEIFRIADEVTVLRDGNLIETKPIEEMNPEKVIELMVGRKLENLYPKEEIERGKELLSVQKLAKHSVFKDVSFNLHEGEIVGFAGLVGAGRTEIMRTVFGLDSYDSGEIFIKGEKVNINSVKKAMNHGMAMVTEDRRRYGIIPVRGVKENITLTSLSKFFYGGRLHQKSEISESNEICKSMNIKTPSLETPVSSLSGGNQQKVILGKWMMNDPEILIFDEPTKGIDVGAKKEIFQLMAGILKSNKGIIMVSSEIQELINLCDRIYVVSGGYITGMINRKDFSQEKIMKLAVNHKIGESVDVQ